MSWVELKYQTQAEDAEALALTFEELGAEAITFQDAEDEPIYEPELGTVPVWGSVFVCGLFNEKKEISNVLEIIHLRFPQLQNPSVKHIADQDWERVWMKDFQPMQFGRNLWVVPSNQPLEPHFSNYIILDPGLAFGTGRHPTTALCLEWLDQHILDTTACVVDYGCGSGILALAALKLGAKQVIAIDHDPQALQATRDNAIRNEITEEQLITKFPTQIPTIKADILIANILANPLKELAANFANLVKPGGLIALSGILENQTREIIEAYEPWFTITHIERKEEWVRVDGTKR